MNQFEKSLNKFFSQEGISIKAKNCIEEHGLKSSLGISNFINITIRLNKIPGIGNKTIYDLQKFLDYLKIQEINNELIDPIDYSNDSIELSLYDNNSYNDSLNNEKEKFKLYVDKYYSLASITSRSKKLVHSLKIETISQLQKLINKEDKLINIEGYGIKTINDLEGLYNFIISSEKKTEKVVINHKDLVTELWIKNYNKCEENVKNEINLYFINNFNTTEINQFEFLYNKLNENNNISFENIPDDSVRLFLIRMIYNFYKNRNTLYKFFQYKNLINYPVFIYNCNFEFNRLSVRTKNVLKSNYFSEDDIYEIDYFAFFKEYYNENIDHIRPSYFGKTGQQIDEYLVLIESSLSEIVNADERSKIDEVRINFSEILGNFEIDSKTLSDCTKKELDIYEFFISYFDIIFSEFSSSTRIVFKNELKLPLNKEENNKISNLTNERIRQIRVGKQHILFNKNREKLNKIFEYSEINYKLLNNYNDINSLIEDRVKLNTGQKINYTFYSYLFLLANPNYYFVDLDIFNAEDSIFKISRILFIHKNFIEKYNYKAIIDNILKLTKEKYQNEIKIIDIIKSEEIETEDIEDFINFILSKNNLEETIKCSDEKLKNNLEPDLETIIENAMLYYNSMVTVEMIQSYIKEKYKKVKCDVNKIRITILHNKNKFYNLGKTGKYGLLNINYRDQANKGFKSLRLLITDCLIKNNIPMHISDIIKEIMLKYNTLNSYSIERIILSTKDFKSIGQSFIVLENTSIKYLKPINHKRVDSINLKFINRFNVEFEWKQEKLLIDYLIENKIPDYQILYIVNYYYHKYSGKIIKKFDNYIINDINEILEDGAIKRIIKDKYANSEILLKIQIRKNIKKYIQAEYHFTILEDDIQKVINYHIG